MCVKFWLILIVSCVFCDAESSDSVISVVRKQIFFDRVADFTVNNTIEYIIEVTPQGDQGSRPSRVSLATTGGDITRPILITARQNTGAQTWQLPYKDGNTLALKLERTLCIYSDAGVSEDSDCANDEPWPRGQFTLHIASSCAADLVVSVYVTSDSNWRLPFGSETTLFSEQGAPALRYYNFTQNQERVRVIFSSRDDACATITVQPFTCPIPQTLAEIGRSGVRMTVQRSGAIQLSRNYFPNGFVVIVIVHDDDITCEGENHSDGNYLWQVEESTDDVDLSTTKKKDVKLTVKPALTRAQYAIGSAVLTAVFLSFYVAFGAFVFAQRFPKWNKLVGPKAVLQEPVVETENDRIDLELQSATPHRRRDSIGTLDSSDNSDTDEDEAPPHSNGRTTSPATPGTPRSVNSPVPPIVINGDVAAIETLSDSVAETSNALEVTSQHQRELSPSPRPFGLPPQLKLADLAKRKAKTHQARSDRYLNTLYTVAVFYALPVVQFVAAFQMILNVSGNLDLCYYNFLCAHPAGVISDFNHVFSNLGYLLLGALFMFQVRRRRTRRKKLPKHEDYGIPPHYGLLSALGAGMMVVALLSASYHVCPNQLNFQFDTAFMYVLAVLSMVKIYQSRHPDVNARAHATFGVLAILIAMVVWGVLGGGAVFWGFFTVIHIFTFLVLTLRIYYVGQFHLDREGITEATRGFRASKRPLYTPRLVLLVIANCVNWVFAIYGLLTMSADFASHLLQVLLGNTLMYMVSYIILKLLNGERLRWYSWLYLAGATLSWVPSLYFFVYGNSSWSATPAQSRHRNHECKVLGFYDSHDLWHILSAISLYLTFNVLLTWDDGLSAVKRTEIAVF